MPTPAEALVDLSDLLSGTPAEHLLNITNVGSGTGGDTVIGFITDSDAPAMVIQDPDALVAMTVSTDSIAAITPADDSVTAQLGDEMVFALTDFCDVDDAVAAVAVPGSPYAMLDVAALTQFSHGEEIDANDIVNQGTGGSFAWSYTPGVLPQYVKDGGPSDEAYIDLQADDQWMRMNYNDQAQPGIRAAVCRVGQKSEGTTDPLLFSGTSSQAWGVQGASSNRVLYNGGNLVFSTNDAYPAYEWFWVIALFDGANSYGETSRGVVTTGDFGSEVSDGIMIGRNVSGSQQSNIDIAFYADWVDGTTVDEVRAFLRSRYPSLK